MIFSLDDDGCYSSTPQTSLGPTNQHPTNLTSSTTIRSIFSSILTPSTQQLEQVTQQQQQQQLQLQPLQPSLNSFKVYLNNACIQPSAFNTQISRLVANSDNQTQKNEQTFQLQAEEQHINLSLPSLNFDITILFVPRLLGGKGGFGANLRASAGNRRKLPIDESNMTNRFGQRLGVENERQLLQQLETDLKNQEKINGTEMAGFSVVTVKKKNTHNNNNNNKDQTSTTSNLDRDERNRLDSVTAIERLGVAIKEQNVVTTSDGSILTASEVANQALSQNDAIKKGLGISQAVGSLTPIPANGSLKSSTITTISKPNPLKKASVDDCGLELSDCDDEEEDEDDEDL